MQKVKSLTLLVMFVIVTPSLLATSVISQAAELFPLEQVRLLDSPFKHAQDLDLAYVRALDPDKLLAPFRREAGLAPVSVSYGNWESSGLDGHMGGHYLSALSLAYASTGEKQYRDRLEDFLGKLLKVQKANGNGYLGGVPNSAAVWNEIAKGNIKADLFSLNDRWVPWYNLHKTYAGLRDAYLIGKSERARTLLIGLGEWTIALTKILSREQIQKMLYAEHGGMNEVLADYYAITGNKKYLDLAVQFSEQRILGPLAQGKDELTGLHANTQIPKVVGFARLAQLTGDSQLQAAADFFWKAVVNERSIAIGGNSVREHFHEKSDFSSMLEEAQGPETCNTYNMLKLTELLYGLNPSAELVNYYERALYNHILSSQHPKTGGLVYFTPIRPQHYRVYSQVEKAMWCCVGSGIENHLKYGRFIYAHDGDDLFVNLFIPSRLTWAAKGVVIRQENRIPDQENTSFHVEKGGRFTLNIRTPYWLGAAPVVRLNGKPVNVAAAGGYLKIDRAWKKGDELAIDLPMKTYTEQLPDGSAYFAVLHGPVVLSAPVDPDPQEKLEFLADDSRMGHVASGALCPLAEAPTFLSETPNFTDKIRRLPGDRLRFAAPDLIGNTDKKLELIPFFRVHDTRYMLYWQQASRDDLQALKARQHEAEQARLQLAARTVDWVAAGQQQPEVEHGFLGADTEAGVHRGRHWRHAHGWFSYRLANPTAEARKLSLTLSREDGGRRFKVIVNGKLLHTIVTQRSDSVGFYDVEIELPKAAQNSAMLEVKLEADPGSVAGGLYEIRLLK